MNDDGVLAILDAHDEECVAFAFGGDAFEPALECLDARLLVGRLRLLRTELMNTIQELLEIGDCDGAFELVVAGLVRAKAHDDTEGERVEAGRFGGVQRDFGR